MSRWRRGEQDWGRGFREGFREHQAKVIFAAAVEQDLIEQRLDIPCGRCHRVLGRSIRTVHGPGSESLGYEGEQAQAIIFGPGVESFVLCEPCAGALTAWAKAGPTAAERARAARLEREQEDIDSEVDAMRELRGKHD